MTFLLSLIRKHKILTSVAGVVSVVGILYFFWNEIETGIYDRGYNDAVQVYQEKIAEEQAKNDEFLEYKLNQLRYQLQKQQQEEVERVKEELETDKDVQKVTEYIEREVYVKEECDTVPVDLSRMFNNTIRSINGNEGGQ